MTRSSSEVPGYAGADEVSGSTGAAAARYDDAGVDPTTEKGQYPGGDWATAMFGGTLPEGTGAPGTQGARISGGSDPTNEPGQTEDGLTGITEREITSTGAPGTTGAGRGGQGPDAVTFTRPGSYQSGSYAQDTVNDSVSGPLDWTQANDGGYGTGGPKLPAMNEPTPNAGPFQPSSGGRVLRGGRDVRP